ncbi:MULTISPECIES: ABC transporter permease [Alphaproteobacteria]|uniref:ABC transporter permease n=2 Tax=Alphaproteobacteria TaxID=28211 RepID=A0A512HN14_9HYPH|nr:MULTISPECIES: ABC transporter permease [Alphaproteobacteria]GEO86845.1 ABC transporter permease [Ciceribacter naphthalenivorans]GLR23989.1 ABC transporter permease [Ciceribacter naphthalenivorans]GLT06845.1 ABC transporter permease [Sphingomonas psychrolutea]
MSPSRAGTSTEEAGNRRSGLILTLPALAVLIAVMALPLAIVVLRSFADPALGFGNYLWFFSADINLIVLGRTFKIAFWVTLCCIVIAYPYAFAMSVAGRRLRLLLILCVLVPFWVSGVVRTLAWVILLQDSGVINRTLLALGFEKIRLIRTQLGVMIGMTQILLPFMIMPLYSVMRGIDRRLLQAAGSLGAMPLKAFFQIYLPLSLPGVFAGSIIVFILALGFYITPLLLGGPQSTMLSTLIQQQALSLLNWGRSGAMGVILLIATLGFLAVTGPFMRRKYDMSGSGK